jgi:hypothetical protein
MLGTYKSRSTITIADALALLGCGDPYVSEGLQRPDHLSPAPGSYKTACPH